jgi:amino acid adenylation domain-containing protein
MTRLQDYLSTSAEGRPESTALVFGDERLTYAELEEESSRLARLFIELGCHKGDRICLFLPKCPAAIVAIHAALKAGCPYVPIDLASPAPRVEKIVRAAEPGLVLAASKAARLVAELREGGALEVPIGFLDEAPDDESAAFGRGEWSDLPGEAPAVDVLPDDTAHILFTSGSTGTPKGVVITHRNVTAFVDWAVDYFGTAAEDRISGHPPLHFDLSTFDIYATLRAGAELHLVPAELNLSPPKLAALIRDSELTQWFSVPSVLTYMAKFDVVEENDFPALRRLLWCGEVLPTPILLHWMRRLPHVSFTNLYGPTEATIASSYYTVPEPPASELDPIPIGTACAGEELLVLNGGLEPAPRGEVGDLYLGGVGLSPGYWRDEQKTSAAFVPDPRSSDAATRLYRTGDLARVDESGLVHFLGRADFQIKSRGYRIELGEIETALSALDELKESAIVGVDVGGFEGTAICCAFAPRAGAVTPAKVRSELQRVLPTYMLPARWLELDELPKNVNGKIDRRRLRELFSQDGSR